MVGFDHHCPWLGTCVGSLNYTSFFAFVLSLNSMTLTMLVTCIIQLIKQVELHESDLDELTDAGSALGNERIPTWILIFYIFIMQLLPLGLLIFHCVITCCKNQTTNEWTKSERGQFFSFKGCSWSCRSCCKRCWCGKRSLVTNDLIKVSKMIERIKAEEKERILSRGVTRDRQPLLQEPNEDTDRESTLVPNIDEYS